MRARDVDALDNYPTDHAFSITNGLIDEVQEPALSLGVRRSLNGDGGRSAGESFAGRIDIIEKLEESLTLDLRHGFANRFSYYFSMGYQLTLSRVDQFEAMFRPAQNRHKAWGLVKELSKLLALGR